MALGSLAMPALGNTTPPSKEQLELALPRLIASDRESEALVLIESYLSIHPDDVQVLFDASRIASRSGDPRGAAMYAIRSLRAGWLDDKALDEHSDLNRLRAHESWQQVLAIRKQIRDSSKLPQDANNTADTSKTIAASSGNDAIARRSLQSWLGQFGGGRYRIEEKKNAQSDLGVLRRARRISSNDDHDRKIVGNTFEDSLRRNPSPERLVGDRDT